MTSINGRGPSVLVQMSLPGMVSGKSSELFVADLLQELSEFSAERKEKCK